MMPALRSLVPLWIKGANGGLRKSWLPLPKRPLFPYLQRVRDSMLNRHVPMGYQDETGFHYGKPGDSSQDAGGRMED